MNELSSFDYLVSLLKKVNRSELRFFMEDGYIYVESKDGHKALLNDNFTYVQHGSTNLLPCTLNP